MLDKINRGTRPFSDFANAIMGSIGVKISDQIAANSLYVPSNAKSRATVSKNCCRVNLPKARFVACGVLGFAIAGTAGVAIYYGAERLPLRQFFLVTGVIVVVLAAGMLANGLNALHEAALISDLGSRPWDSETTISMTSTMGKFLHTVLGYDSAPATAQIVLYWVYTVIVLGAYLFLPVSKPRRAQGIEAQPNGAVAES